MVLVYGRTDDDGYSVLRRRGEAIEVGAIRALEEGKPIHGEIVKLNRRAEHPLLFDVDVLADTTTTTATATAAARSGPPQVASNAYREHWDAIFGDGDIKKDSLN